VGLKDHQAKRFAENWICTECDNPDSPVNTPTSMPADQNTISKILLNIEAKLLKIDEIEKSTNFIAAKFDTFESELKKIPVLEAEVNKLMANNNKLQTTVKNLERQLQFVEQEQLSNQLIINNISVTKYENLKCTVQTIAKAYDLEIKEEDILETIRLNSKKNSRSNVNPAPILVKLSSSKIKAKLLS
jgi:hypothetical protein